jgi:hypothetical protein
MAFRYGDLVGNEVKSKGNEVKSKGNDVTTVRLLLETSRGTLRLKRRFHTCAR